MSEYSAPLRAYMQTHPRERLHTQSHISLHALMYIEIRDYRKGFWVLTRAAVGAPPRSARALATEKLLPRLCGERGRPRPFRVPWENNNAPPWSARLLLTASPRSTRIGRNACRTSCSHFVGVRG